MSTPWCYDDLLPSVRKDWDAHDKTCESMPWFWLGREGGHSSPTDLESCDDCGVTFDRCIGVAWVNWQDDDADEVHLCGCCARKRGHSIEVHRVYGISVSTQVAT